VHVSCIARDLAPSVRPLTNRGKERARQAAFRHGGHTKQAKAHYRETMTLIRQSKDLLSRM
jgi:hypothetical protein